MIARAIGYIRASTDDQTITLAMQAEKLRAYGALRGLDLVEIVEDAGVSGSVPLAERPAGQRVAGDLKRHKAAHVVALKLDRLFRDAADALAQTKTWDKAGIALHLCDMGGGTLDTSSPMGRMMLTMLAGLRRVRARPDRRAHRRRHPAQAGPGRVHRRRRALRLPP
jgi:DNA invertase Pin-like site-specific DNA recombinase